MKTITKQDGIGAGIMIMLIGLILVLGYGVYFFMQSDKEEDTTANTNTTESTTTNGNANAVANPEDFITYDYEATLEDVSGGTASGVAQATFDGGAYLLLATFENLPTPATGYFYEGWVVKNPGATSVISTGALDLNRGAYRNTFTATTDLTDHALYVLTLEPDDGDPAPAGHVLEGTLVLR